MKLLTIKEAATALKVTEKTLRRWEEKKFITPIRTTGRHRRYSLEQLKSVKKFKNKKRIDISEVRHLLSNEINQVFTNSPLIDANSPKISKPNFVKSYALKLLALILFSAGGLTAYKIKSNQNSIIPVFESADSNQSVLAATSFQNSDFSINIPTILNSTLTLGNDTISDFTGDGLSIVNGALTAKVSPLGDSIISSEIVDGTISEVDLLSSNTPSGAQVLTFNSVTGGFTWANQTVDTDTVGTNYFTDSGDTTYLTSTSDDFAIGGSSSSAPFFIDSSTGTINLNKTAAGKWINFSDGTDTWGLYNRAGTPEGFITANTGTLAMDTANGTLYVKTDDSDATGWVNLATGVSSPWSETAGLVTLGTTTSNVNVGGSSDLAKLAVDGDTDEIQFLVQGNSTQTANLAVFENSSGVDLLSLSNSGGLTIGSNGTDGALTLYSEQGTTDYSTVFQLGTQTENITYTLPIDNGVADNYVLTTDGTGILTWESVGGVGGMSSFTLSGDSGIDQTISDTNTLEVAGGTNGIDTVGTTTDAITLNLDTTEIGTTSFGSGSGISWTFDAGATDPLITFASGSISFGSSQFSIDTTNGNLVSAGDIAINGGDITATGDLTITPIGADVFLADGTTINIGGNGTDVAYNAIGDTTSGASANVNSDDDLYVEGNLEVDGSLYAGGIDISTFVCPDCIDFDDMEDTLDLDAALTINQDTLTWTQNFTGSTTTGLTYNANSLTTGSAINVTTSSNPAGTGPVSPIQFNLTSTNATTATTFNAVDIGFTNNPSVAGNTEYVLQIQNETTSNTTDNTVAGLVRIDNADTSTAGSTVATNGLLITNSGDIAGGIVNAINIDDTDIATDIVLQNDETIDNNTDGTITLTAGVTSLSGDLTVTGGDITLNTAGTIIPSGSGTITIGNSSLTALTITTDGTGDAEVVLPTGSISGTEILDSTINEVDLNATNSPTPAYILSYDVGGGFTWISNTGGTGASKFTDSGSLTYLTDSTDSITVGSSNELAKLAVDGDANEIQFLVQGNATQTAGLFTVENSAGTDFFAIEDLGGLAITPSSTDDVTITTDADSTVVITGLSSGSGTALCLDGSNNMVTCTAGSGSSTLQSAYDADTNGSDTIIALTTSDDSIVINNPASSGTDSAFSFQINNLATGVTTNNFKNLDITTSGTFNTTAGSLTNYAGSFSNTSTESAGANTLTNVGLYVTSSGGDTNYSAIFESGNFGIGDTSPTSLFTVGATDAFQVNSSGNIVAIGGAAHAISNSSGNLTIIPASSGNTTLGSTTTTAGTTIQSGTGDITFSSQDDFIFSPIDGSEIDITAVASTTLEGVIDMNIDTSVTGGFEVQNLGLTVNSGATAGDDFTSILTNLTANDADADLFGIQINSAATVNAGAGSYEALIRLDNAENTIATVTDGILITSSSSTDQDITDAIDVSHTNIVNAINIGANIILGTTANIDLTNFDVTGSNGNITTAGDIAINGGNITSTGDFTLTPTGADVFLSDATTLNIGGNATDVAYNIIGDNNTNASASMTSDDDLYIEGFLEADSGTILSPDSTNDISIVTDGDSTLNVTGLSSGTGNALCLDGSSNVITCTVGSGGISGSGTAGQVAFFDTSSNITSEASGFGWDSTNNLFTLTAGTGNTTQTAQTIASTAQGLTSGGLLNTSLTNTSATASFTGDILGVSSNRDNDTALQTLTDTGNLVEFGRTTTTNSASAVTNVTGAVLNITNTVTATAGTIADSANLISVSQDADATGALLYLNTNRSSTGTALLIEQSSSGTDILQVQDNGNLTIGGDLALTGGNITTAFTADSTVTVTGTLTANGVVTLGDNGDTVAINSSDWDINATGDATGIGGISATLTADNQWVIDGTTTDSTSTGGVIDLNVDTITTGNIGLNVDHIIRDSAGITAYGARINETIDTDAAESSTGYGLYINGANNDVSSTLTGLYVDAGTGAGTEYAAVFMNGNVGIGTTSPADKLQIVDAKTGANPGLIISDSTALAAGVGGGIAFRGIYTGTTETSSGVIDTYKANATSGEYGFDMRFLTRENGVADPQERIRILSTGLVGIGTTAPDAALEINHATGDNLRLTYNDSNGSAANYTDFALSSTGDLTIDSAGGNISFADADSLIIGGHAGDVTYNVLSNSGGTPGSASIDTDNDLYIQGSLEVDGASQFDGTVTVSDLACTDCLDFAEFANSMSVDEATDINLGAFALTIDLDSTGDFSIRDVTTDIATFADSGAITFAPTAGTAFLTNLGVGSNVQIATTANPTADLASITNASFGTTTNGVDGLSLTFVTGDGTDPTNNGVNLALTSGGTAATDVLNGINFGLTGTSGTERGINFSDNNFDTDINATTDLTIGIGGTNEITLTGTDLAPSTAEGNSLGSATLEWEEVFVGDDAGVKFGLDQDWSLLYDEATDDRLELTTAGTTGVLIQSATATGTELNLVANSISTGTILQAETTSTALTTAGDAFLGYFDWTPGSATTASGDLFRINIGSNGNVTNVFNVTDNGSSLFSVSENQITSALPHSFTAAGDVNIAYDLVFTNQTASIIDSYGPLTIRAGESFESNNLTLQVYNSGQVVVASGSGQLKMNVEGWIEANLNHSTSSTEAVCGTSTAEDAYDTILDDCTTSVNADYAEIYPTESDVNYGDIVIQGTNKITSGHNAVDENGEIVSIGNFQLSKLTRSNAPYQDNVIGIASNNWSDFSSTGASSVPKNERPLPIALSGRVPVNVTTESGPILAGDILTTSSTHGAAMKAVESGRIIGQALEDFNEGGIGQIMVFVNNSYYNKPPENAVTRQEIENLLMITEQNQALLEQSASWNTNAATSSAEFSEIITDDLFVTGIAALDSISVSQTITLNNNLVIGNGNIDSLTTPLNIQGSGAQALNFMSGKVTIDTSGNMVINGNLKVLGTLDAKKVSVSDQVAGTAKIITGTNEVTILNENIKLGGLIFVTPTSPTKNNIYVKSQIEGQAIIGFDPEIVNETEILTTSDINFNWWIVGITN